MKGYYKAKNAVGIFSTGLIFSILLGKYISPFFGFIAIPCGLGLAVSWVIKEYLKSTLDYEEMDDNEW